MSAMTALFNTTRRRFLSTFTLTALGTFTARASYIKRSQLIRWINGATLPLPTSPSFSSAKIQTLTALEQGLAEFKSPEIAIEFISFLPDGSTVEHLLLQKVTQGEITFAFQTFDGLGSFIRSINGQSNDPNTSKYWRLEVNGIASPDKGISQKLINTGDSVRLVLGSALNDHGIFTETLGDYSEVLVSQNTPLWRGRLLTSNDWPRDERGSLRYEFFDIVAPPDYYFVPQTISATKYVEKWDTGTNSWILTSTIPISISSNGFIGKSWNHDQESSFDQASTKMFYGGTGTGFPPLPGSGPEIPRIAARLAQLRTDKVRIRIALEVTFVHLNGSSFIEQCSWITLKDPRPFKKDSQPLVIKPGEIRFAMPEAEEGIVEIQTSSDLKDWTSLGFTDDSTTVFNTPAPSRLFTRATRY